MESIEAEEVNRALEDPAVWNNAERAQSSASESASSKTWC